jgi:hypothetical protein
VRSAAYCATGSAARFSICQLLEGVAMKHVPKKDWMGCAVATAAMLADLTYEEAAACHMNLDLARTRWPQALCALLKDVTDTKWQVTSHWFRRPALAEYQVPECPVAVFLEDAPFRPRFGQWIVVKRDIVHDPGANTVYTVGRYPRRDWYVTCVAHPVRPAEFARNQVRRRLERVRCALGLEGLGVT